MERLRISPARLARQFRAFYLGLFVDLAFVQTEEERRRVRETFRDYQELMERALFAELI